MYATLAVLILGVVVLTWYVVTYNAMVNARNAVDQSWSNVEVELKRRFDLIDNLVAVVKGYAAHESQTLERVVAARSQLSEAHSADEANAAQRATVEVVKQLVAVVEAYPDLKADAQFRSLGQELTETENRIAERRHAYNQNVNRYQDLRQSLPSNIAAGVGGFEGRSFFDAPDELANQPPAIQFT